MHGRIHGLPISGGALFRLLCAVALLAVVVARGETRLDAQYYECYKDPSSGCYGEGCGPIRNQYIIKYAIDNYHCYDEFGDDWYEAEITGCCADALMD
jgi:hypothetical protein